MKYRFELKSSPGGPPLPPSPSPFLQDGQFTRVDDQKDCPIFSFGFQLLLSISNQRLCVQTIVFILFFLYTFLSFLLLYTFIFFFSKYLGHQAEQSEAHCWLRICFQRSCGVPNQVANFYIYFLYLTTSSTWIHRSSIGMHQPQIYIKNGNGAIYFFIQYGEPLYARTKRLNRGTSCTWARTPAPIRFSVFSDGATPREFNIT